MIVKLTGRKHLPGVAQKHFQQGVSQCNLLIVKNYYPNILNRHSADLRIFGSFTRLPRHLDHYLSETH